MSAVARAMDFVRRSNAAFVREHRQVRPEDHLCPHCGAGLSRLILLSGFLHSDRGVKALLNCRECGRAHRLKGRGEYHRTVFCVARDNVRKPARHWRE